MFVRDSLTGDRPRRYTKQIWLYEMKGAGLVESIGVTGLLQTLTPLHRRK